MNRKRTGFAVSWFLPVDLAKSWDTGGFQEQYPYLKTSEPFCPRLVSCLGADRSHFSANWQPQHEQKSRLLSNPRMV